MHPADAERGGNTFKRFKDFPPESQDQVLTVLYMCRLCSTSAFSRMPWRKEEKKRRRLHRDKRASEGGGSESGA